MKKKKKKTWWSITLLVTSAFFDGVALSALGFEDFLSGLGIARGSFAERRHFLFFCLGAEKVVENLRKSGFRVCWGETQIRGNQLNLNIYEEYSRGTGTPTATFHTEASPTFCIRGMILVAYMKLNFLFIHFLFFIFCWKAFSISSLFYFSLENWKCSSSIF